jgi:hypothetical protein
MICLVELRHNIGLICFLHLLVEDEAAFTSEVSRSDLLILFSVISAYRVKELCLIYCYNAIVMNIYLKRFWSGKYLTK